MRPRAAVFNRRQQPRQPRVLLLKVLQPLRLVDPKPTDAKESSPGFRAAPDWLEAKKASEETAGGSLTVRENGVVSEFIQATEYSPLR